MDLMPDKLAESWRACGPAEMLPRTDPDAVRSKKKKKNHTNLSRERTPLLIPIGSRSHIFRLGGVGKELQSSRKERKDPPQRKIRQQVDEDSKKRKKKK